MKESTVVGDSLLDKIWREMDVATDAAMDAHNNGGDPMVTGKLLGQARGLAIAIHVLSAPHFHSADAVASCAVQRWKNGTADGKAPAPVKMAPPDGVLRKGTDDDPIDVPAPGAPDAPLTEDQRRGIAAALMGGQQPAAIAAIFGVTEAQVATVVWE